MDVQDILGSPPFVVLGIVIAHILPPFLGRKLAQSIAKGMRRRRSYMFLMARENLAHVVGDKIGEEELDSMAETAIYHSGSTCYDMFRLSAKDYQSGRAKIKLNPKEWARACEVFHDERGTVIVGPHMSNFDLVAQWFAAQGFEIQALGLKGPSRGTQVVNLVRRHRQVTVTPITMSSLRSAVARLRGGGIVATGVDRPVEGSDELLPFFGVPGPLPTGHIRLALRTNSRIVAACCTQDGNGCYSIRIAPPLDMQRTGDRAKDVRHNAMRVLAIIEDMIRQAPEQWLMFVPVWPGEPAPKRLT